LADRDETGISEEENAVFKFYHSFVELTPPTVDSCSSSGSPTKKRKVASRCKSPSILADLKPIYVDLKPSRVCNPCSCKTGGQNNRDVRFQALAYVWRQAMAVAV
jgi:hypothetical protein